MNQEQIQILIDRCVQNDQKAFAVLVAEYQTMVFRLSFRLLCDEDEARDMVQETFTKVWISLDKYNRACRFSTWIYKIASNTCYDRLRAMQHSPAGYRTEMDTSCLNITSDDNVEQNLSNKDLQALIFRFTEELTPKQKLVFTLRDVEGLDVSEVEVITGMSAEKIKSNLYQARKQIRIKINQIDK